MAMSPQGNTFTSQTILDRYRPSSRHKIGAYETTYGHMNDWMKMQRQSGPGLPVTMSDSNFQEILKSQSKEHDMQFQKSYNKLTSKIAYRYPNPGMPRQRQGRIGGSWRHIKEVLGHGGSRVVYVDGLISVYDTENFNQTLNAQVPMMPHVRSQVAPDIPAPEPAKVQFPPVANQSSPYTDGDVARKMGLNVSPKYKGFYRYGN